MPYGQCVAVGNDQVEHGMRLVEVLMQIKAAELTLNTTKCELSRPNVKYLGHCISKEEDQADPEKTATTCKWNPLAQ